MDTNKKLSSTTSLKMSTLTLKVTLVGPGIYIFVVYMETERLSHYIRREKALKPVGAHAHMPLYMTDIVKVLIQCLRSADNNGLLFRLWEKMKADADAKRTPDIEELRLAANMPPINSNKLAILCSALKASSVGVMIGEEVPIDAGKVRDLIASYYLEI